MLTSLQIACIIAVLNAFGVDPSVLASVQADLAPKTIIQPVEVVAPPVVQTAPTTSNTPVQPVFGSTVLQANVCDDTPAISVQVYGSSSSASMFDTLLTDPVSIGTNEDIAFEVQASSACGSTWLIDQSGVPFQKDTKNQTSRSYPHPANFYFKASQAGTYPVVFTAHDRKTVGTTTEMIVVQ